jgi:hypothetical protein
MKMSYNGVAMCSARLSRFDVYIIKYSNNETFTKFKTIVRGFFEKQR